VANLLDIKTRITSVKKTRQITSAMKLVAGAKLRRATENALAARPYKEQLAEVLKRVGQQAGDSASHPLLSSRSEVKTIHLVLLNSDRGLCGPFNNGLLRLTESFLKPHQEKGVNLSLHVLGRKGVDYLTHRNWSFTDTLVDYSKTSKMELVQGICDPLISGFETGAYDETYLCYNRFVNPLVQTPTIHKLLPLSMSADEDTPSTAGDYRYEPNPTEILDALLPLYIRTLVLQALLETEAGEYAARMAAMDNATRNADDLIDGLTLDYNRARQAAITTEIIEIVTGAQALE
jgi:F-type H+-transporting ATPase subunit gamma